MRHQLATIHELARLDVFAGLSGDALGELAVRMWRIDLAPGEELELEDDVELVVVLTGLLSGPGGILGDGAVVEGRQARSARLRSIARSRLVACDTETYEQRVRELLP